MVIEDYERSGEKVMMILERWCEADGRLGKSCASDGFGLDIGKLDDPSDVRSQVEWWLNTLGVLQRVSLHSSITRNAILFHPSATKCSKRLQMPNPSFTLLWYSNHHPLLWPRCSAPFSFRLTLLISFRLFFSLPHFSGSATASTFLFIRRCSLRSLTAFCTSPMIFR